MTIFVLITIFGNAHRPCKDYSNIVNNCLHHVFSFSFSPRFFVVWRWKGHEVVIVHGEGIVVVDGVSVGKSSSTWHTQIGVPRQRIGGGFRCGGEGRRLLLSGVTLAGVLAWRW